MENKEFSPDEIVDRLFRVKIMRWADYSDINGITDS
jgi:hypothetical protein